MRRRGVSCLTHARSMGNPAMGIAISELAALLEGTAVG